MKKLFFWILIGFTSISVVTAFGCAKKEAPPKAQEQQKEDTAQEKAEQKEMVFVSSTDKPEACASCHVNKNSLNAIAKKIEGHPQVSANTVAECAACHQKEGYPALDKLSHKRHYQGQDNAFVDAYKGSCVHCHKVTKDGEIFIPGLAPAATEPATIEVSQIDKSPNGCLDCHKDKYSIPNTIKKIPGHPPVDFEDFNQCYKCHGETATELGKVLHEKHLYSDTYKKNYGNSCLNCHKLGDDGTVVVKGKK